MSHGNDEAHYLTIISVQRHRDEFYKLYHDIRKKQAGSNCHQLTLLIIFAEKNSLLSAEGCGVVNMPNRCCRHLSNWPPVKKFKAIPELVTFTATA